MRTVAKGETFDAGAGAQWETLHRDPRRDEYRFRCSARGRRHLLAVPAKLVEDEDFDLAAFLREHGSVLMLAAP